MVTRHPEQLQLITPESRADYRRLVAPLAVASWPEFMLHDPVSDLYWASLFELFAEFQFGLLDSATARAAAMGNSVPLRWNQPLDELPECGWDWAFQQAVENCRAGIEPNILCAIQVALEPAYRGYGISTRMVQEMRAIGRSKGFTRLIAPVRPSQKADYPLSDIDGYITWMTHEGYPFDAWLRVHCRTGARIIKVCHQSMTISGTVQEWQSWTNLSFRSSGPYYVPGALNPVQVDVEANRVVYVEPNVWMVNELD